MAGQTRVSIGMSGPARGKVVAQFGEMFGIWALLSAGWIAGINLAAAFLTHPAVNWSELMGRARYWAVLLALPIGLAVTLVIWSFVKARRGGGS
jgi:hypothetical protein